MNSWHKTVQGGKQILWIRTSWMQISAPDFTQDLLWIWEIVVNLLVEYVEDNIQKIPASENDQIPTLFLMINPYQEMMHHYQVKKKKPVTRAGNLWAKLFLGSANLQEKKQRRRRCRNITRSNKLTFARSRNLFKPVCKFNLMALCISSCSFCTAKLRREVGLRDLIPQRFARKLNRFRHCNLLVKWREFQMIWSSSSMQISV